MCSPKLSSDSNRFVTKGEIKGRFPDLSACLEFSSNHRSKPHRGMGCVSEDCL